MKISLMWMTRGRSHELLFSIMSFAERAADVKNIEFIIVTDPDDNDTLDALEKILPMASTHGIEFVNVVADKRYGYAELDAYQNLAAKHFTGECLLSIADDNTCIERDWDVKLREALFKRVGDPSVVKIQPLNEKWKGNHTIVGPNRAWYDKTNRFSGNRATDAYLADLVKAANIDPIYVDIRTLHLQRGKEGAGKYHEDGVDKQVWGLPSDEASGGFYAHRTPPKYYHILGSEKLDGMEGCDTVKGKKRFDEDLTNLLKGV